MYLSFGQNGFKTFTIEVVMFHNTINNDQEGFNLIKSKHYRQAIIALVCNLCEEIV